MATKVDVDKLGKFIAESMKAYAEATEDIVKEAIEKTCVETKAQVAMDSPKRKGAKGGSYSKSWKYTRPKQTKSHAWKAEVYNQQAGLTQLLEYGHATRNGGRTKPQPHIAPANEKAAEKLLWYIERGIKEK